MITREQLIKIMPHAKPRADIWLQPLNDAMSEFGIDTQRRVAAFLAQLSAEAARRVADAGIQLLGECEAEYGRVAEAADKCLSDRQALIDGWPK